MSIEIINVNCIRIVQGFISLQEISDWLITHRIVGAGEILNEANETCGSWVHSNGLPSVILEGD
ncbi:unannotated protein [freshwater metagenome]|uniref:Unannotated protein n=1 Tax=freshwater metagenome TaxID=449393 RepID=A0A6J7EVF0_9ZZZZ|nr:hypothetical protein [Actinomycetota bacterium]